MKIHRVRIANFGGVAQAEGTLAPKGVTIIQGPNEAGKSTLMHAINVLFDHRDDSRKEEVRFTKPVDRDVGSEVEVDVEIGPYRFTYFKRYHKDRETRLTVSAPKPENHSGREAHERVQQILSDSVDVGLWRALRIVQGERLEMPDLENQPALARALDQAAGQALVGEREEALFEAVRRAYGEYFTETGRERESPLGETRRQAEAMAAKVAELSAQLALVEGDVERFEVLERAIVTAKRSLTGLEDSAKTAQARWDTVSKLNASVERATAAHQLAEQSAQTAKKAVSERGELVAQVDAATKKSNEASAKATRSGELVEAAARTFSSARGARDAAQAAATQRETEERVRSADRDCLVEEFELVRMRERMGHVKAADDAAKAANAIVAATKITDKLRAKIRAAELALNTARGIFNSASPQLGIRVLKAVAIVIDGKARDFSVGDETVMPITAPVRATIADAVELRVEPGASSESLQQAVADAEHTLAEACQKAAVASPEAAEAAWNALQDARRVLADRDRVVNEHLRDLTREDLAARIESAQARTSAYRQQRSSDLALPQAADEAQTLVAAAASATTDARRVLRQAEAIFAEAQEQHSRLREEHAANTALLGQAEKDHAALVARLEAERVRISDGILTEAQSRAAAVAAVALGELTAAQRQLADADPDAAKERLDAATAALDSGRRQCDEQEREFLQLRTRLDLVGEKGLAEELAESQRAAFETGDALNRLLRRAGAARLLHETLAAERDAMRRAYVAPLREGIERLGRHVFGPTLRVEVDDALRVVNRTVNGNTLAVEQLSTGAREQLGVLVRLAAAQIVSKEGGVPLVLDDALGSSDEGRLASMGAVLRVASTDSQTILLTCAPERYAHVGAAQVVRM